MSDPVFAPDRVGDWTIDAIAPSGDLLGRFAYVEHSGSHSWTQGRQSPMEGSCLIGTRLLDGSPLPDWATTWVRVTYHCDGVDHVVATGVPSAAPRTLDGGGEMLELAFLDPTYLLARARLRQRRTFEAGTPVAETVRALIATYAPVVRAVVGDTDETVRDTISFEVGTPILEIINKLLEAAGYMWLTPTADGVLRSSRWVPAAQRPVEAGFAPNAAAFLPEVTIERDLLAPTEVVAKSSGSQANEGVVGKWPEFDVPNPITEVIEVEATSVAAATAQARKHFERARQRAARIPATGPFQPWLPGRVMPFQWQDHAVDELVELTEIRAEWAPGPTADFTLEGVTR